jgi:peroxiredoxin
MSIHSPGPRRIAYALVALVALPTLALSADATAKKTVDPAAKKVIDAFSAYFASLKGFQVTAKIVISVDQQGQHQQHDFLQKISAERPNKLACTLESPQSGADIVSDGSELSVYFKAFQKYATEEAPPTLAAIVQNPLVLGAMSMGNAASVTSAILDTDPARKLLEKTDSVSYGGLVTLDDVKCHLISATGPELDWQLWIDASDKPVVRKFVPDLTKALAQMAKQMKGKSPFEDIKVSNAVTFEDWDLAPKFTPEAFAFHTPEGATKAKSIMDIIMGGRGESGPHPLLGKAAPELKLDLLDGGSLDLASYKDKKIVILDFWATWCGPCTQAMPIIDKVAKKYEKKGVLLFAVNIQEDPDDVRKFLDENELHVDVALDKEGAAAKAYLASAIPQTVLIGKDGSVQVVLVGLSANLEEDLSKDLDALIAGKNLAAEALAASKGKDDDSSDKNSAAPPDKTDKAGKK